MRHARKNGWGAWHGRIGARVGLRDGIGTHNGPIPLIEPSAIAGNDDAAYYHRPRSNVPGQMYRLQDDEIEIVGFGVRTGDKLMGRMYGADGGGSSKTSKGSQDITLHGFPAGTKLHASMDDLLKSVNESNRRQMETSL